MTQNVWTRLEDVTVVCKANVYFDGKVVSHTVLGKDGTKRTLGLIYPGSFHFDTAQRERMDIVAGVCRVRVAGEAELRTVTAGEGFDVPASSGFDIEVGSGIVEYVCSFA